VQQLLAEKGDLNKVCVALLPWLATGAGQLDATSKAAASSQEARRQKAVRQFHQCPEAEAIERAPTLDLGLFLTRPPKEKVEGREAANLRRKYFKKASEKLPELASAAEAFERLLEQKRQHPRGAIAGQEAQRPLSHRCSLQNHPIRRDPRRFAKRQSPWRKARTR
jgi:hypothetical protein